MDFSITEEQSAIKDVIARFIENEYNFEKRMKIAESDSAYDKEVYNFFVEQGFTAIPFSEKDGGLNGGPVETMLIMKEIGRGLVLEPFLENIILAGGVLKRLANQRQKDEWLNKIINGEMQSTLAFTEPQSRFQLNDVATAANKKEGNFYILKSVLIPNGSTLVLSQEDNIGFDNSNDGFSLRIKSTENIDVIIKK